MKMVECAEYGHDHVRPIGSHVNSLITLCCLSHPRSRAGGGPMHQIFDITFKVR